MEKATGGKVKVNVYAADQLTNGNQSEGIQALIERRSGTDLHAQQSDLFCI
ncbi:MAG: hypothetical protein ACLU6Y_14230 [Ruminococcus sp.]